MTTSVVEKAENATSVDNNRAHSNRGSRKNKCSSSEKSGVETRDTVVKKELLCYGHR